MNRGRYVSYTDPVEVATAGLAPVGQPALKILGNHPTGCLIVDDSQFAEAQARFQLAAISKAVGSQTSQRVALPDPDLQLRDLESGYHWRVRGSSLLAHDEVGSRVPRFLYRTANGRYFVVQEGRIRPLEDRGPRERFCQLAARLARPEREFAQLRVHSRGLRRGLVLSLERE